MMKKLFTCVAAVLSMVFLTSCSSRDSIKERTSEVFDMGAVDLPGRAGYKLHGYHLLNGLSQDHFVYIVEKDEVPVAGAQTNYDYTVQSGKAHTTHTESISSAVAPSALPASAAPAAPAAPAQAGPDDTCQTIAECQAKINALAPKVSQLQELQQRYQTMQSK